MDSQRLDKNEEMEIDLHRVLSAVLKKSWLIAIIAVLCAVAIFFCTYFFVQPKYDAGAKFYVNNSSISIGNASVSISSGDLVTSRGLVDSYIVILKTRETLNEVIDYAGVNRTYSEVKGMLQAEAVDETEIFQVTVTSTDPNEAEKIANAIAYILPKRIATIIEGTSAKVVEAAIVPANPSSPNPVKNTVIGFLLGFILSVAVVALRSIFDITIRTEDDIEQVTKYPVLTAVPDMTAASKGGSHYYGYGNEKKRTGTGKDALFGSGIGFAASEAYKLLRTKLQFSFADDNTSHVIAVSSALSGEGKSLSSINLAYSLAELGKKVVLVDCDMRRPTLAEKLGIDKQLGLSSYLTRQSELVDLVQYCGITGDERAFHVIASGQNPPNPIELLSSARMALALNILRKSYDYVILDLPPVGEVSDALAIADKADGTLLIVRQNYCNRIALNDTIRQFEFVNMKLLGVVFNGTKETEGKYGKKYYKKYYNKSGRSYQRREAVGGHKADQK